MPPDRPDRISIDHDDRLAEHVGRTADGRQFFLTTPFDPGRDDAREFVALYLFDASGKFLEAHIDDFGPRKTCDENARRALLERRLLEIGPVTFTHVEIEPFSVERFGITFGLIASELSEEESDEPTWTVEVMPGNYMAFFPPWDSGQYDT